MFVTPVVLAAMLLSNSGTQTVIDFLGRAKRHAEAHGAKFAPVLSAQSQLVLGANAVLDSAAIQKAGFAVVIWTVDEPDEMRELIRHKVDGIISDRSDLLQQEMADSKIEPEYRARFIAEGHRGGRNLRPENTLPAFEVGLDNLMTTLETDTGVTADHVSLISHEQFINPQTCRAADGSEYTSANQILIKDISMPEAQRRFVCDKLFRGPSQKNDLALSPVAVSFAAKHGLISPYVPTNAEQLFEFAAFYAEYYRRGAGRNMPQAEVRRRNAEKVRFDLETKIDPRPAFADHTFAPEVFVDTLCKAITRHHMEGRSDVQSFDYRTLLRTQEKFPTIPTVYLLESLKYVESALLPEVLQAR